MAAEAVDCSNSKICLSGKDMVETRLNLKLHFFWKYNFGHIPRFFPVYTALFILETRRRTLKPRGTFRKG